MNKVIPSESYMAVLPPHPLYASAYCRGHSNSWLQPSRSSQSSSLPSSAVVVPTIASTSLSSSPSVSSSYDECKQDQPSVISKPDETHRQRSIDCLPRLRPLWLSLLLQWTLAAETRRSFITNSLQTLSSPLLPSCAPQPSSTQFSKATKSTVLARRAALMIPFVITASSPCSSLAVKSAAEETANVGRSFLQNLGIGDGDIFYPRLFEGSWICNSTLVAVDTPQGEEKADSKSIEFSRKQLGYTVTYKARFIPFEKYVIGDRLFTTLSLVESTVGSNVVDHGVWSPDQPDRLTLVLRGGLKVQNVVTKRSSSLSGPGQFDTSEYSQQIFDNNRIEGGPPTIKASQNQTRYRWDPTNETVSDIEAFQRVSMYPVVQESLANIDILNLDKPVTVYKYIVRFTRERAVF
ncbi:hypothetical protein GOP47_0002609 [Adiantum capillus-veneris]|uniref:DUF6816 domain-containing protein n=1 Tax=Adiantum capillus-veneris TaxID=13818 RepID=A0A9D4VBX5_ADICA|nr:hypothetical protein GOP47_0002609 [Adiantum capillus-veneris]